MADSKREITFKIVETLGEIGEGSKGWRKCLRLVSWNDKPAKFDIREWSPDDSKMGKGITLTLEEISALKKLLNAREDL